MLTNLELDFQLIAQHRAELIAEADRYRLLSAARKSRRSRRAKR
jgi:hypothetical protein